MSKIIAWYPFNDAASIGKDISGNNNTANACGKNIPQVKEVNGRMAAHFDGGEYGASYLELPKDILKNVNDNSGLTILRGFVQIEASMYGSEFSILEKAKLAHIFS